MDDRQFDRLAMAFAAASRRQALRLLAGGALGGLLARAGIAEAADCARPGQSCGDGKRCCAGAACAQGTCRRDDAKADAAASPRHRAGSRPRGQGNAKPKRQGGDQAKGRGQAKPKGQGRGRRQGQRDAKPKGQGGDQPRGQGRAEPQARGGGQLRATAIDCQACSSEADCGTGYTCLSETATGSGNKRCCPNDRACGINCCPTGASCVTTRAGGAQCVCPSPTSACPAGSPSQCGACLNLNTDVNNCGTCGRQCTTDVANAHPVCNDRACGFACNTGFKECRGACIPVTSCCTVADCAQGQDCCSGICTPLGTVTNCARCGDVCTTSVANAHPVCNNGTCDFACNPNFTRIGQTCCPNANVCGNACLAEPCSAGLCESCSQAAGACVVCGGNTNQICLQGQCCTPEPANTTCAGKCGAVTNNCGQSVACGGCTAPNTCGGGGVPNVCGCTPEPANTTCAGKCGNVTNNCGQQVTCPGCGTCQQCSNNSICVTRTCPSGNQTCCATGPNAGQCRNRC